MSHLENNAADRALGDTWELKYDDVLRWYGKPSIRLQENRTQASRWSTGDGRRKLLGDFVVFGVDGGHHETKHKNPSRHRCGDTDRTYGLESYRLEALLELADQTSEPVYYTIHDWSLAGAKHSDDAMPNILQDWRYVDVRDLAWYVRQHHLQPERIDTWLNGKAVTVMGYYWPTYLWRPLHLLWGIPGVRPDDRR